MFLGLFFSVGRPTYVTARMMQLSMILSAVTVVGVAQSVTGQTHILFPWIKPALAYAGGQSGALGAMVAGALIIGDWTAVAAGE